MFDSNSRYANLPVLVHTTEDGRVITYVSRRFLPESNSLPSLGEITTQAGDRPDLVAYRGLGDPLAFWMVADANDAMDPAEICDEPGENVRIPVPQP
ncbi:hypothetical protein F183_A33480 [Bryobacterales bacterium F-183]|nr:hypothetical protein F183_A33480 [Bryobacterales bacterium F-183]